MVNSSLVKSRLVVSVSKLVGNVSKAQRCYGVMCSLLRQKVFKMIKRGSGAIMRGKSV